MTINREQIERYLIETVLYPERGPARVDRPLPDAQSGLSTEERLPDTLLKPVADDIRRIAERYTSGRTETVAPLSARESSSYALYYFLINLEKIQRLLRVNLPLIESEKLRVLDYGAGPGTAAFALALERPAPFFLSAIDHSADMRAIAGKLLSGLKEIGSIIDLRVEAPESARDEKFDLIFAAHVLNELPFNAQVTLAHTLLSRLAPNGTIFLIESALKEQTRELMALRDLLLHNDSSLSVAFPCTHQLACPMLARSPDDWCHGTMSWQPPFLVRQLDQLTGFNKHRLKYSAFVLTRNQAAMTPSTHKFRVVAPPEKSKVGHQLMLCGAEYYGITLCKKRSRSEENIEFRRAEHYDRLTIEGTEVGSALSENAAVRRERAP